MPTLTVGIIRHGSDPNVVRGTDKDVYFWIGTVEPLNMADIDEWHPFNTAVEEGEEGGGEGAVSSVFGRTGDVAAEAGDYDAGDISGLGDAATKNTGSGSTQVAAGDDGRFPSSGQKNALAGLHGTPGTGNEYATKQSLGSAGEAGKALKADDATTTNARTPSTHASSHKTGGTDAMAPSDIGAASTTALSAETSAREGADALKADKTYVDGLLAASDAVVYKGAKDCSANPKYPAADAGHLYRVSVAGKIGGGSGTNVEVGDTLLCNTDGAAEGTQAEVGSKWNVIQANVDGAVVGPAASTNGNLPVFEGTTGKTVKDGGKTIAEVLARGSHTGTQTASTISDFDTQVRTSRLDQMAKPTAKVPIGKQRLTEVAEPTEAEDAANKAYADTKLTQATADGLYLPQVPGGLVSPIALGGLIIPEAAITVTAKRLYLMRCIVPKTGKLRDLTIFIVGSSGNAIGVVTDTGDTTAEKRTKLWDSGSVAVGAANEYQIIGDPNLAVTRGQQIEMCVTFDNSTVTFGRTRAANSLNAAKLPAAFNVVPGGASPKLWGIASLASFAAPSTIKESEVELSTAVPLILARIS